MACIIWSLSQAELRGSDVFVFQRGVLTQDTVIDLHFCHPPTHQPPPFSEGKRRPARGLAEITRLASPWAETRIFPLSHFQTSTAFSILIVHFFA